MFAATKEKRHGEPYIETPSIGRHHKNADDKKKKRGLVDVVNFWGREKEKGGKL